MPRGDKSKYSDKQERKAEHIEESYEERIGLHEEREITNLYQHQQLLTSPTDEAGAFRFYIGLLKFDSEAAKYLVLAMTIAPASIRFFVSVASYGGTNPSKASAPPEVGMLVV